MVCQTVWLTAASEMHILALTFGDEATASSYYRIYQYCEPLAHWGIQMEAEPVERFRRWDRLREYDAVIIQKKLMPPGRLRLIRQGARRLIYDIDDAIWEPHDRPHHLLTRWRTQRRLKLVARLADCCLAANEVVAGELRRHANRVEAIPMSLDESVWFPRHKRGSGPLRIGWAGAPVNLAYLTAIESALQSVQRTSSEVEFVVYSGQAPQFKSSLKTTHVRHQRGVEPDVVRSFDIGLLPLPDNAFAQAKSPIKGLQYMACGLAIVASPRSATRELFRSGRTALFAEQDREWSEALLRLAREPALREQLGRRARLEFVEHHERNRVASLLASVLHSLG